jgi:DNA invertase Pin-like site-specific DNA recombinase
LSRLTDESTSAERQREIIERWASDNDHEVIGWAEDMDVSGSVDPFDAPALGPWFREEHRYDWDILVAWKLDRLSRRAIPMSKLFGWIMEHDKTLVCVADNIDLGTLMGRLIAYVIATIAEGELEAIRERTKASHRKLRELGRWPGGKPAYGYQAQEREDAAGWELVHDEHASTVLCQIIDWVLAGESTESIAKTLTDRGELAPSDYLRQRVGDPVRGGAWNGQSIRKMLASRTLLGHVTHEGVTVRDAEGVPVHKGPALVSRDKFDQLQSMLEVRRRSKKNNRTSKASPLLGVAICRECDTPLHHRGQTTNGKLYRYYYCRARHGKQVHAEELEELVEQTFLEQLGQSKVKERVYLQAENHQTELDEAVQAIDELTPLLGTITSATMRKRITEQLSALDLRISQLEKLPVLENRWEVRETYQTYADAWEAADTEGQRRLLLRSGITAVINPAGNLHSTSDDPWFELRVPQDIQERLSA